MDHALGKFTDIIFFILHNKSEGFIVFTSPSVEKQQSNIILPSGLKIHFNNDNKCDIS